MHHRGTEATEKGLNTLTGRIIGAAMEVHRAWGPGLLESAYETCLARELELRMIPFDRQRPLKIAFKGVELDCAYRMDFVVEGRVLLELKAVERIRPIHEAQILTCLRLACLKVGLLMNFHVPALRWGIRRFML